MKKYILLIGIGILALVLFIGSLENTTDGEDIVIEITAQGFNPSDITIQQGQTVTFLNTDELAHWPASNIHPTHELYPGSDVRKCGSFEEKYMFDACNPVEPGESYAFAFDEAGSWKFHDHIVPLYSGRITVEPVEGFTPSLFSRVEKSVADGVRSIGSIQGMRSQNSPIPGLNLIRRNNNGLVVGQKLTPEQLATEKNYEDGNIFELTFDDLEIRRVVYQLGVKRTMERLVEESGGGSNFDCHLAAHYVGRASYDIFGTEVFSEGNASCHSGFYHGAMENLFRDEGLVGAVSQAKVLCGDFETPFGIFQCFHGIGHGLLAVADYDVPETVSLCGTLGSDYAKNACYTGAFMENIVTGLGSSVGNEGHVTEWLKWDDLHYPCNEFPDNLDAQKRCYETQTSWMLITLAYDYEKVNEACLDAPESMIPLCFQSFGRDIGGNTLRNPERTRELCNLVPEEYRGRCIFGAVNTVIDFWGPALETQAGEFCSILDEGISRETCYARVIERIPELFERTSEQKTACGFLNQPYQTQCVTTIQ